jgi:hypothetical protein
MTSTAQAISNRINAQLSSGPRSDAGKLRAARNATSHGLTSERFLLLPNEIPAELDAFAAGLRSSLAPDGALEHALVDRIVSALWRLRRTPLYEAGVLRAEGGDEDLSLAYFRDACKGDALSKLGRYIREAESSLRSNMSLLERVQARRRGEVVPVPIAVDVVVTSDPGQAAE